MAARISAAQRRVLEFLEARGPCKWVGARIRGDDGTTYPDHALDESAQVEAAGWAIRTFGGSCTRFNITPSGRTALKGSHDAE